MSQGETGEKGEAGAEGAAGVAGAAGAEGAVGRTGLQGEAGPAAMLDPETAKEIKHGLRMLMYATVMLFLMLFAVTIWNYIDSGNKRDAIAEVAVTAKHALCTFRGELKTRVAVSQKFLDENPKGIPGITAAQIQLSLDNQRKTVRSLSDLKCP